MSRYNVFRLRAQGTKENCNRFFDIVCQYNGQWNEPYVIDQNGTNENYVIEVYGSLRGDVYTYFIDPSENENSMVNISKTLNLEIEIFGSDPSEEDEYEYYYCKTGELYESLNLPTYVGDLEESGIAEEDWEKYYLTPNGYGYLLSDEYVPDAKWERKWLEEEEETVSALVCNFKIKIR